MESTFRVQGTLSARSADNVVGFVRRRFCESWDIFRYDVDRERVIKRDNLLVIDNGLLIATLGLEASGELVNACVEKGHGGGKLLLSMILQVYRECGRHSLFAETPVSKSASARAFLKSGMHLVMPAQLHRIAYPEKTVTLARLEVSLDGRGNPKPGAVDIDDALHRIREIREHDSTNRKTA